MNDIRFIFQINYQTEQDSDRPVEESNVGLYALVNPELYKYRFNEDVYIVISGDLKLRADIKPIFVYMVHFIGTDERYTHFMNRLIDTGTVGVSVTPDMLTYPDSDSEISFPTIKKSSTFIIPHPKQTRIEYIKELADMLDNTTEQDGV